MAGKTQIIAEPGKQELFIIREFDAPRELVFRAHVDPDIFVKWIGPRDMTMEIDIFESRNGGTYRYINRDKNGNVYAFRGVNHEVLPPERIINTFEFEMWQGHVALGTLKLEELPGNRTKLVSQSVFQSVEDRDGMIRGGMEGGVNDGYERLDEILARQINE